MVGYDGSAILITGATGTVGSEVIRQLLSVTAKKDIIKAGGRSIENVKRVINSDRVEAVQIDYKKPETIKSALRDVDKVFLLTHWQSDLVEVESNLLREIKDAENIKHIVKSSVIRADSDPGITGSRLHRQVENIIEGSGITYTFLCANFFMQSFIDFIPQKMKEQGTFYLSAGDGKVSFVDVRDVAAVAIQALTNNNDGKHNGRAYNITGPEAISFGQAARILSKQIGKKIAYVNISDEDARNGMKDAGLDEWTINFFIELYRVMRLGYLSQVSPVVEEITGRRAISFSQFAKDYAEAFR